MKKSAKLLFASVLLALSGLGLGAQNLKTAYFTEGYSYRYHFNPALAPTRDFAMIGLGCLNVGAESNLSIGDFLPKNEAGKTTLFISGPKYVSNMLNHLQDTNKGDLELSESVLACGFWTGDLFHSVEVNVRASGNANVPRSFMDFMYNDEVASPYSIGDFALNARSWAEVAYGISIPVAKGLRLGVRAKFLAGIENIDITGKNIVMEYDGTKWNGSGYAEINGYIPPVVYFPTKGEIAEREGIACSPERVNRIKFSEKEWGIQKGYDHFVPGFGGAIDLGLSYDFARYFTIAASVTDLGLMCWRNHDRYCTPESWSFVGYSSMDENAKVGDQWDTFSDDFDECFPMEKAEVDKDKLMAMMRATVNASFEVRMPFYERLSVGVLGTAKVGQKDLGYAEGRFVATITPVDWLSLATSYAYSTFGHSWGAFLNINCKGLNFFAGVDSLCSLFKFENSVPSNRTIANCSAGLSIAFGKKHSLR